MITLDFGKSGNLPAAAGVAYVTDDFNEAFVYFPTDVRARKAATLSALFDGVGLVRGERGKVYFPIGWLAREYPKQREALALMKARLVGLAREMREDG